MATKSKRFKFLSVLLAAVMLLGMLPAGILTANAATEGVLMYSVSDGKATVIGCETKASGEIVIPETLGEGTVTAISLYAFAECESIKSIVIPDSVETIGHYAFSDCTALSSVKIGKGVKSIGNNVFSNCTSLEKIEVSSDNASYTSDETGVLYNKAKTELLVYPASNSATIYTVAENVKTVADSTFAASKNVKTIVMGDNVTTIGMNAFSGSRSLESVIIGKGVTSIGKDAFEDCSALTGISVVTDNTTYCSDENGVLYNKAKNKILKYPAGNARESFVIPDGVTEIDVLAFSKAVNLKTVTVSRDVKTIGASAFYACTGITNVIYSGSEKEWKNITIGANNGFLTSANITYAEGKEHEHSYTSSITTKATCTTSGVKTHKCECGKSYTETIAPTGHSFKDNVCTKCSEKEYVFTTDGTNAKITAYNGVGGAVIIPSKLEGYNVNAIADSAFENCEKITSVAIPDTVKDIGSCAFYKTGYYNNSSNWEDGVLYIGNFLIEASNSVKGEYKVKDGTKVIADYAFASRSEITSVTFPKGLEVIGDSAFSGCTGIKSINCGVSEEEWASVIIGRNNESITSAEKKYVHIHSLVTVSEKSASCTEDGHKTQKCSCGYEETVTYPATGHTFSNNVCSKCSEREYEISIVDNKVTIIGCNASLSGEVKIPETIGGYKVTAIGSKAFMGNEKIEKLIIPSSVSAIGQLAFAGSKIVFVEADGNESYSSDENGVLYNKNKTVLVYCPMSKAGESLEMPDGITTVGAGAFYGCKNVKTVKIPESVTKIEASAFEGCTSIESVAFSSTQTKWKKVTIESGNEKLTSAKITFENVSDIEAAQELAKSLNVIGGKAEADGVVIIVTAAKGTEKIEIAEETESKQNVSVKTEGTPITKADGKYSLSFSDWHKAGNKTETEIVFGGEIYTLKLVFEVENGGHNYGEGTVIAPSCVTQGCTRYTCSVCGEYLDTDVVPAKGHQYGEWIIDVDETCTAKGTKHRECTVCSLSTEGHTQWGNVPAAGHSYSTNVTAPTCVDEGYTTYTCTKCPYSYKGDKVPASGHLYGEWTVTKKAECEKAGERECTCSVCDKSVEGHTKTEKLDPLKHSYKGTVTPPTYTSQGYTTYVCEHCGDTYVADYTDSLSRLISVSLDDISMKKDETVTLSPTIEFDGTPQYTVTYESLDTSIATVSEDGVVTAKTKGNTQIVCTVTDKDGKAVSCVCNVEVKFTILQWITWFIVDFIFGLFSGASKTII